MTEGIDPAMPAVTRVILVRHGESVANAGGRTPDHIRNPLTQVGRAQSSDFAQRLDCVPTLLVTSSFLRAQQTAEPVQQRFPDAPIEEWPIHEFNFLEPSRHHNTTEADREPHVINYWRRLDPEFIDGPGAESFRDFLDRAREAVHRLESQNLGGCVVIFTHGYFMQAFRLVLLFPEASNAELMSNFRRFHLVNLIRNTDSLEFEVHGGKIRLIGQPNLQHFTLQGENSHA